MMTAPNPLSTFALTGAMLAMGSVGAMLALWIRLPMPWMLGPLLAIAVFALTKPDNLMKSYRFPQRFRDFCVSLIGVMIGAQVTPDLLAQIPSLAVSLSLLAPFVVICHLGNFYIFHRLGGYDRATAFYSGTPGGLMESIFLGEAAGADIRILTTQQFLRIVLVISFVPLGLSFWLGHPVGSAAGLSGSSAQTPPSALTLALIAATAFAGQAIGRKVKLPAAQLIGPMVLAGIATGFGLLDLHLPAWLVATAQLVIGTGLGLRFAGVDGALLRRSFAMAVASVLYMLVISLVFAAVLHLATGFDLLALLISFAPGGVTEMSLVALSIAASPAVVSLHHVVRIMLTVFEITLCARWLGLRSKA